MAVGGFLSAHLVDFADIQNLQYVKTFGIFESPLIWQLGIQKKTNINTKMYIYFKNTLY